MNEPLNSKLLLLFLQGELQRVLTQRAEVHVRSCTRSTVCKLPSQPSTEPGWLAQGRVNIVFRDSKESGTVYRFGFFAYDSDNRAKERVGWNEAMKKCGISVCRRTTYEKLSDKNMSEFNKGLNDALGRIRGLTGLQQQCYEKLVQEKEAILEKASRALEMCSEKVGHAMYLFCEESSYAQEGNLAVFLLAGNRTEKERIAAWEAAYNTVTQYTKLFEARLKSGAERRCDAVLVDLKPPDFLVYKNPSSAKVENVVFQDAGLYNFFGINASASELSLRSLQLLSSTAQTKKKSLCNQLSLGIFATLLVNCSQAFPRTPEAFETGIQVLENKLNELASSTQTSGSTASQQAESLLRKAVALTANLRFPRGLCPYFSFLDVAPYYVPDDAKKSLVHSAIRDADKVAFQALHDYALTPQGTGMTAAAEQYIAFMCKVFACKVCKKPKSLTGKCLQKLLTELNTRNQSHLLPGWLQERPLDFHDAFDAYNKDKPEQGFKLEDGKWPAYPVVFYDRKKEQSKRSNVVTFFFLPASHGKRCVEYLAWNDFLCLYQIGASETRSYSQAYVSQTSADNSSADIYWLMFCYTQPDDEGILADISGVADKKETAAKAWVQLFRLMYRYARALLQWSKSTAKEAEQVPFFYFGAWDPTYVAVYSYIFEAEAEAVVTVRLLEPKLLVQLQAKKESKKKLPRFKRQEFTNKLQTLLTPGPLELAVIFYLSLLANGAGAGQPSLATEEACATALSPLLQKLKEKEVHWQKATLGAAPRVAKKLGLVTPLGSKVLSKVCAACKSATIETIHTLLLAELFRRQGRTGKPWMPPSSSWARTSWRTS